MDPRTTNPDSTLVIPERFPGGHHCTHEEGTLCIVTVGPFTEPDMQLFLELGRSLYQRDRALALFLDATGGFSADAAARKRYAQWAKENGHIPGSTAVIGASIAARAIITLLVNAAQLINRKPVPLRFFPNRRDALAWLALERARWLRAPD